jgi:nickel-dependent lactate racemase
MVYFQQGSEKEALSRKDIRNGLESAFKKMGKKYKILALPPDFTRYHSQAGMITELSWEYFGDRMTDVMPALGTHTPMSTGDISKMFGKIPADLFRVHDWRNDIITVGEVPATFVKKVSEGAVDYPWPAQVNKLLLDGGFDLILSIGQVVPHEVVGMANYNKNIFVGTGGVEGINKSHFLGAAYGMERMMGRVDTPVRKVLNYASEYFADQLPIVYIQTVIGKDDNGCLQVRGLYIGDDMECFSKAAELSLKVNFEMLQNPLKKVVVYLDPSEFKSTWLGNKSIYRTRMAIADGGELIVLAPGLKEFGEDKEIDRLIRKYGYVGTGKVLEFVQNNAELKNNLSAAAHLIHGSSEGRFNITYCPGDLTRKEIESAGFKYANPVDLMNKYNPEKLKDGMNIVDGEEIFFVSNPALGLWAHKDRFN